MPSLRQLLADHPTLLLIDTASARVQIGLWSGKRTGDAANARWEISDSEASVGLFANVEALLGANDRQITDVNAFVFCEGPGSVLGIRMAAVALRTWQVINPAAKIYRYQSLDLVSHALNHPEVNVIADARRDTWHVARLGEKLRRVAASELSGECVMPQHFRHWTALPANLGSTGYELPALLAGLMDSDLFHVTNEPDAFSHEDPSYVTWTPQIHQAPRAT